MLKNLLSKTFLLLCALIVGGAESVWADATADVTYDFANASVSGNTVTASETEFSGAGSANFKMNNGYFMMGKSGAYIQFPTYNKPVEKIVVTGKSGASSSTKMNIFVGETAVSTETKGSTGTNTYQINSSYQDVGTVYTLKVTSDHNAQITKIEVFFAAGPVDLTSFAFGETAPSVTLSKNDSSYEAEYYQTVTADPSTYDGAITYAIDEENSTFNTNDVVIDDETGELTISTTNNVGGTIVVKASGEATDAFNAPADATYTLTVNAAPAGVGTPTFSLAAGSYYYGTTVEIESVNSTLITYTTDGSDPTMESTTYSAPVAITKTMTLKAKAWDDALTESTIASVDYTLKAPEAPTFSVEGGEVVQGSTVALTAGEGGSVVVYTTDGSTPTIDSDIYDAPIAVNAAMTIKAATVDDGDNLSAIASYDFTVKKVIVYEKVTDASTLAAGDKLLLVYEEAEQALANINSGGKYYNGTLAEIKDSKITNPSASVAILTLGGNASGWTLQSSLDDKYLKATSSNELRQSETVASDYEKWTITISEGVASVTNVGYNTRTIKYNASNPRFACYTSGQKSLALYRLQENLADATITITPSEAFELNYGGTKVLTVTTTSDADITAESSDESVATVALTGTNEYTVTAVSGTAEGVAATITFSTAKTATYKAATATVVATMKDSREDAPISFAQAAVEADMEDAFTGQALTNASDLAVTWESSAPAVATVASDGTVTLVAEGTTTISASFAGNATYKATVAQYELTVTYVNRPGGENNPYTVAEAIANTPESGTSDDVYISGIVSEFYGESIVDDGSNYRYYISDNGTTENQLLVYKGKGLSNVAFSDASNLEIGDKVVILGGLTIYNDAPEVAAGNYIVSLTRKAAAGLSFEKDAYEARLGSDFETPELQNPNSLAVTYSSSNPAVATVNVSTGAVTLVAEGNTTITAAFAGNETYKAGEASYELTVTTEKLDAGLTLVEASVSMNAGTEADITTLFTVESDGEVTYESDDETIAKVAEGKLVAVAPGEATITISVTATDDYKAGSIDLPVAVTVYANAVAFDPAAAGSFVKVTATEDIVDGDYLIVNEENKVAFNGSLETLDAEGDVIEATATDGVIAETDKTLAAVFTINVAAGTLMSASGQYIGVSSNSNGLKQTEDASTYRNSFEIDNDGNAVISALFSGSSMSLRYNKASNQTRFRYYKSGQEPIQLYRYQSASMTVGTAEWRTLVASKNVQFPSSVKAYIVTANDDETATLTRVSAVKAGVPVVVNAAEGSYALTVAADEDCEDTSSNLLAVSSQNTSEGYVLAKKTQGVGFYNWTGGWMGAGRVYLPLSALGARSFIGFSFDDQTTGVALTDNEQIINNKVYDLQGRKMDGSRLVKGLYIVNGKKMVIK